MVTRGGSAVASIIASKMAATDDMLIVHNPHFWHNPMEVYSLFVTELGQGSLLQGFKYYCRTMLWKAKVLLKLTFGLWDDQLLKTLNVEVRAEKLDVNPFDDDEKIESLLQDVGDSHSISWQLLGLTIFLVAGEMFNKSLIFTPRSVRSKINTPFWLRLAQWLCNVFMYGLFCAMIIVPWAFPFISVNHVPKAFWDDEDHLLGRDGRYYTVEENSLGHFYCSSPRAFHALPLIYSSWTVVAGINSVLDFVKFKVVQRNSKK